VKTVIRVINFSNLRCASGAVNPDADPLPAEGGSNSPGTVWPDGRLIASTFFDARAQPARWLVAIIPYAGGLPVKTFDLPPTAAVSRSTIDLRAVALRTTVKA
jgi:hypothetical protein